MIFLHSLSLIMYNPFRNLEKFTRAFVLSCVLFTLYHKTFTIDIEDDFEIKLVVFFHCRPC